jgi:hypothetical protein
MMPPKEMKPTSKGKHHQPLPMGSSSHTKSNEPTQEKKVQIQDRRMKKTMMKREEEDDDEEGRGR